LLRGAEFFRLEDGDGSLPPFFYGEVVLLSRPLPRRKHAHFFSEGKRLHLLFFISGNTAIIMPFRMSRVVPYSPQWRISPIFLNNYSVPPLLSLPGKERGSFIFYFLRK